MAVYHIFYNPLAGNSTGEAETRKLDHILEGHTLHYYSLLEVDNLNTKIASFPEEDRILLSGGDGTLNRFVNRLENPDQMRDIYYYASGSGNDFFADLGKKKGDEPILVNEYIRKLPVVTVNGKSYRFINGVGYGIDGYCCEVGDSLREKSDKPINYTGIAIKGLLFHYKRTSATVTVDGETHHYRKVWLAPTMNGRLYGGGMIPTPDQKRLGEDRKLSTMIMYGTGKLHTLMVFPTIFKGEHVKHRKMVEVLTGKTITVEFDKPTALQIDGETVRNVTKYTATL